MAAFHIRAPLNDYVFKLVMYLAAAVLIRSCGCTVNDIVDRDIDAHVGKLSSRQCWIYLPLLTAHHSTHQKQATTEWESISALCLYIPHYAVYHWGRIFCLASRRTGVS